MFSCKIKGSLKVVSLCATVKTIKGARRAVALAYRFGKPGAPEFEFPAVAERSLAQFEFSHYFRPGMDSNSLSFRSGDFSYSIYESSEVSQHGKEDRGAGLSVSGKGRQKGAELTCDTASIVASWRTIDGAVPCEEGDEPNSCEYQPRQ